MQRRCPQSFFTLNCSIPTLSCAGKTVNGDSINAKVFEEEGVGFGEGEEKPFFRKVLLPLPNFFPLLDYMKISLYKTIRSS